MTTSDPLTIVMTDYRSRVRWQGVGTGRDLDAQGGSRSTDAALAAGSYFFAVNRLDSFQDSHYALQLGTGS